MGKATFAVLAMAGAMALANAASATIMQADINGDWNDDFQWESWSAKIVYDTSLMTESVWTDPAGGIGHQLIANPGSAAVLSETVTLYGYKTWRGWLGDYDTFTPIPDQVTTAKNFDFLTISQSPNAFVFDTLLGTVGSSVEGLNLGVIPLDRTGAYATNFYNYLLGFTFQGGEEWTYNVELTALSGTPEPGTWALMIAGLGMAGAVLRRRRAGLA